jgi:hypothetical protein
VPDLFDERSVHDFWIQMAAVADDDLLVQRSNRDGTIWVLNNTITSSPPFLVTHVEGCHSGQKQNTQGSRNNNVLSGTKEGKALQMLLI